MTTVGGGFVIVPEVFGAAAPKRHNRRENEATGYTLIDLAGGVRGPKGRKSPNLLMRKLNENLHDPFDKQLDVEFPPHFTEAHEGLCALIENFCAAGIPTNTILAAIMTELMPRLVQAYGPSEVATMLRSLASEISGG